MQAQFFNMASDAVSAAAFLAITAAFAYVLVRRRMAYFTAFLIFGVFFLVNGAVHLAQVWAIWTPADSIVSSLKGALAILALAGAVVTWRLVPWTMARPTARETDEMAARLEREALARRQAEAKAEAAAHILQNHVARVVENMSDAFYSLDNDWRFVYVNKKATQFLGKAQDDNLIGKTLWESVPEVARDAVRPDYEKAKQTGKIVLIPRRRFRGHWFDGIIYPHQDGVAVFFQDVTERINAEGALEQKIKEQTALARFSLKAFDAENFSALMAEAIHLARDVLDCDYGSIFFANAARDTVRLVSDTGWDRKPDRSYVLSNLPPRSLTRLIIETGGPVRFSDRAADSRFTLSDEIINMGVKSGIGTVVTGAEQTSVVFFILCTKVRTFTDEEQEFLQTLANVIGVLMMRDQALQRLSLRERALEAITQGITITDDEIAGNPIIYTNPAFTALTKYTAEEIIGRGPFSFFGAGVAAGLSARIAKANANKEPWRLETRIKRKDGTSFLDSMATSLIFNKAGNPSYSVTVHEDVTETRQREEMLLEAQKMESVGQLTGGIAHDFNNLLTAIKSSAEDLHEELAENPLRLQADIVLRAADRGAGLVAQLMAFARKQELKPQVVNVNTLLDSFIKLLRSTLPANIDIVVRKTENLPPVRVDPARLESALLNLAVNARDAMPNTGTLTIETMFQTLDAEYARENLDVPPGRYVLIAVTDSGTGMPKDVAERAFTPFFTTKEVGKGTGLGLSMVYGFVKQSGGNAKIYSELGFGTVIKIYLPAVDSTGEEGEPTDTTPKAIPRGQANILLVEDDELVRQSIGNKLTNLGYTLTAANTAHEAIKILEQAPHFDLLFTDIIMPGTMNGADLVREVRRRWPEIHVLMTSGYTESTALGKVDLPQNVRLLSKPYSSVDLAAYIHQALGKA